MATEPERQIYWKQNLRLVGILLTVWFAVSFGCSILFVDWLDQFKIGGFPLGFWIAQQGSIFVFVLLIWIYVWLVNRLDREHNVHEDEPRKYDI